MPKLLIGGTFNPIHKAHVKLAIDTLKELKLRNINIDQVLFIPTNDNLGYKPSPEADAKKRIAMIDGILSNVRAKFPDCKFLIDETQSSKSAQISDALIFKEIKERVKDDLYYAVGADCVIDISKGKWSMTKEMLENCKLVAVFRPDEKGKLTIEKFEEAIKEINAKYYNNEDAIIKVNKDKGIDISSTDIREAIRNGHPIYKNDAPRPLFWQDIVGEKVEKVIGKNKLYGLERSRDDLFTLMSKKKNSKDKSPNL